MKTIEINVKKLHEDAQVPVYAHSAEEDAGCDLASIEAVGILPGCRALVRTGLSIELPPGFEAQIRSRSGLALKKGVFVLNSPGTIDPSYRGEIGVILYNSGTESFVVQPGDRIAQMVIAPYVAGKFRLTPELCGSQRGGGGFGSTQ